MFGDYLKENLYRLSNCSMKKSADNAFWKVLQEIAYEEIKLCAPQKVDSINAIPIYYDILCKNEALLPPEMVIELPSNKQARYRVANRNMWSSNAFHSDGLAKKPGIVSKMIVNESRGGRRILYQYVED